MRRRRKKRKVFLIILLIIVLFFILKSCGHKIETTADPDTAPVYERRTESGQLFRAYKETPTDYRAAAEKTIKSLAPAVDTSHAKYEAGSFKQFTDGMTEITVAPVLANDQEYYATVMLEFKDEDHKDYAAHYVSVGDEVLLDDGLRDSEKYTLMED